MKTQFIAGFAAGAGLDPAEASTQWDGFSHQWADSARDQEEAGGYETGLENGRLFAMLFGGAQ